MALVDVPAELGKAYWDKKKGVIPAGGPLESQLKAFDKKSQAIDWSAFDPGWEKRASAPKELDDLWAALEKAYRAQVVALKSEAQSVADAAQKLSKDKGLAKPTLDAIKTIADAAKTLGKDIDQGLQTLEKAYDKAATALKAAASGGDDDEESGSQLLDPKRLLSQLTLCKRNAERRVQFGFVNDNKAPPVLCLAPKTAGRRLFALLQAETGIKTGAFGTAWIAEEVLYLSMDKPYGGLVKKVRAPLKAVGFRVRKIVLASEDGTVVEQDEETEADSQTDAPAAAAPAEAPEAPAEAPSEAPAVPPSPDAAYLAKLAAMQADIARGLASKHALAAKIQPLLDFAAGKVAGGQALAGVQALLTLEKLLTSIPAEAPAAESPAPVDRAKAFNARLAALQPNIKTGMAGPQAEQLKPLIAAIGAAKGNMDLAEAALDKIEALLEQSASSGSADPAEAQFQTLLASLEERYLKVLAGNPKEATKLRAVMGLAQDRAEKSQFAAGLNALKQLATLLDEAATQGSDSGLPEAGIRAYRQSLLEFRTAYDAATRQIEALKKAIPEQLSEEADLAEQLAEGLRDLTGQLQDLVDQAMVAAEDERAPTKAALIDGLSTWKGDIASNPLIAHVDGNPFGVEVRIAELLGTALGRILDNVPGSA